MPSKPMSLADRKPNRAPTLLIDDEGGVNDSRSLALRTRLNAVQAGDAFGDYAVRNLGFVALLPSQKSAHVRLRPSHVSPVAFAGLMYWLADHEPDRVMLTAWEQGDWQHQMLGNGEAAATKIAQMVARAQRRSDDSFLAEERNIDALPTDDPMHQLYEARAELEAAVRRHDLDLAGRIMSAHVGGRHLMSSADHNLKRIILSSVGNGFAEEASYWMSRIVGHRLEDMPDARYGAWTAESYAAAMREGIARLHDIDIMVQWPSEKKRRYRTRRLLLPMKDSQERPVVLSASLPDAAIDLRRPRSA